MRFTKFSTFFPHCIFDHRTCTNRFLVYNRLLVRHKIMWKSRSRCNESLLLLGRYTTTARRKTGALVYAKFCCRKNEIYKSRFQLCGRRRKSKQKTTPCHARHNVHARRVRLYNVCVIITIIIVHPYSPRCAYQPHALQQRHGRPTAQLFTQRLIFGDHQ